MDYRILIIDIETTGSLRYGGKIVEVGIVELDLSTGEKKVVFDKVVHESGITFKEVYNSWIVKNSSLTVEDVKYSKPLYYYQDEIQSIIDKYVNGITAYNNTFDFGFMESRGFVFHTKLPCPMKLATNVCKLPRKRGGYKWPSLQEAIDYFFPEIGYIEAHRGADDALYEADVIYELYKLGVFTIDLSFDF